VGGDKVNTKSPSCRRFNQEDGGRWSARRQHYSMSPPVRGLASVSITCKQSADSDGH